MCNLFKNSVPLLLIILKLCINTSGNATLKDLAVICGVLDYNLIKYPPLECKTMAGWSDDILQVMMAEETKGSMPLLMRRSLSASQVSTTHEEDMGQYFSGMNNLDFQFLVLDLSYETLDVSGDAIIKFSEDLGCFVENVRLYNPAILIGISVNATENKIDLKILDKHVDFFLLLSIRYRTCDYQNHQADMNILATAEDIAGSLKILKDGGVNLDKVVFTVEFQIESRKDSEEEVMDYTYLCENELSKDRKYCFHSVQNLFDIARLRITENAAGIFLQGIEYDDVLGTCNCITDTDGDPCFRGVKIIAGASQENSNDVGFYDCSTGEYPIIQD